MKEQYLVKDSDGEYILVIADNWECGGNGLCFFIDKKKVAHFLNWSSYRFIGSYKEELKLVCKGKCDHGYKDIDGNELFCSIKSSTQD